MLNQSVFNVQVIDEMWEHFLNENPNQKSLKTVYCMGVINAITKMSSYDGKYRSIMIQHEGEMLEVISVNALMAVISKNMLTPAAVKVNDLLLKENQELKKKLEGMTKNVEPSVQTAEEVAETVKNDTDLQPKKRKTRKKDK